MLIDSDGIPLPAWFIPARGGAPGPGVVLVHGWESARDRPLPMAVFLHAAGFHCLTFDVSGNGANPAEELPLTAGEFGVDALAAFDALIAQPEVTVGAIAGHSMGGIGAILAAAADPRVAAVVATSSPVGPYRLTRQTFRLARLPIPDLIAYPLALLTTRVYLRPRGHRVTAISAAAAIARYRGPVLLAHGERTASCRQPFGSSCSIGPRGPGRRPRRRAGRDPRRRRRPALVAVRVSGLPRGRCGFPRPGARWTVGSVHRGRARGGDTDCAAARGRGAFRGHRRHGPSACEPSPRSRCRGRPGARPEPDTAAIPSRAGSTGPRARPMTSERDAGLGGGRDHPGHPPVRRPAPGT